jgi:cysteine/O-acetylserine efflux protein
MVSDMPVELIPAFLFYCLVSSITPGPANLCSLASALNFGKKQALIQWRGLFTGFTIVSLCSVFTTYFIGTVIGEYVSFLSYIGAVYILWLAWNIWKSGGPSDAVARKRCNFYTGLFVNLTNVKIMIYCLTALSAYVLPYRQDFFSLLAVGLFLPFTGPIANLVRLFAGAVLKTFFSRYRRNLNTVMALSLVFCAYSMVTR